MASKYLVKELLIRSSGSCFHRQIFIWILLNSAFLSSNLDKNLNSPLKTTQGSPLLKLIKVFLFQSQFSFIRETRQVNTDLRQTSIWTHLNQCCLRSEGIQIQEEDSLLFKHRSSVIQPQLCLLLVLFIHFQMKLLHS